MPTVQSLPDIRPDLVQRLDAHRFALIPGLGDTPKLPLLFIWIAYLVVLVPTGLCWVFPLILVAPTAAYLLADLSGFVTHGSTYAHLQDVHLRGPDHVPESDDVVRTRKLCQIAARVKKEREDTFRSYGPGPDL